MKNEKKLSNEELMELTGGASYLDVNDASVTKGIAKTTIALLYGIMPFWYWFRK